MNSIGHSLFTRRKASDLFDAGSGSGGLIALWAPRNSCTFTGHMAATRSKTLPVFRLDHLRCQLCEAMGWSDKRPGVVELNLPPFEGCLESAATNFLDGSSMTDGGTPIAAVPSFISGEMRSGNRRAESVKEGYSPEMS